MSKLRYDYGILPRYCAALLEGLAAATPDPATVVEIGTYEGNSLVALLRGLSQHKETHVWTIDLSDRVEADELVERAGLSADRYTRITQDSAGVAAEWDKGPVDLVYVDGDHSEGGVRADIEAWGPHVKIGGLMVFDDYRTPNYEGSTKAIHALMFRSNEWRKVAQIGRCVAFEKLGGVADWQRDIAQWKTLWPTEIDWQNEPLIDEAWIRVNYGWEWPGYPTLPESPPPATAQQRQEIDLDELRAKPTEKMTPQEIALLSDHDRAIRGLSYDSAIYDADWFQSQGWQHPWIEKLLGWFVGEYGRPASSLDLGAGDGYYSQVLSEMGADPAVAVEVSKDALPVFGEGVQGVVHDLREPLDLEHTFDLVLCLEVAEHLPQEAADVLCDTIARHCQRTLLFTAARPKQGGHGHCNLQPFDFWAERLRARGISLYEEATDRTSDAWKEILGEHLPWLWRNITVWGRAE